MQKFKIVVKPNNKETHPHKELNNENATAKEVQNALDLFGFVPNHDLIGEYGEKTDTHTVTVTEWKEPKKAAPSEPEPSN